MFGIINWASNAINWVSNAASAVVTAATGAVSTVIGTVSRIAVAAADATINVVNNGVEIVKSAYSGVAEGVSAIAAGIGNAVSTLVANPLNVGGAISALATGASNAMQAVGSGIAKTATVALQSSVSSISSAMSFVQTSVDSLVTLGVALMTIPFGFNQWQMVELPVSSGAACGNGSPYRFFVNKTPMTTNTLVYMEGGGMCWDYKSCSNQSKDVFVANKKGEIPRNYMTLRGLVASILDNSGSMPNDKLPAIGVGGLESPFTARMHPAGKVQTQNWNIVFMPYCTADMHAGNVVRLYSNPDDASQTKVYHHKGHKNAQLAAAWMKTNLPRPDKVLITGSSAGGYGASLNFGAYRDALSPKKSAALLSDSGVFFWTPQAIESSPEFSNSLPAYNKLRSAWRLDEAGQLISEYKAKYPSIDTSNFGSIVPGWAKHYPNDRFGSAIFSSDMIVPNILYSAIPSHVTDPNRIARSEIMHRADIENTFIRQLPRQSNLGYYIPNYRSVIKSHTLAILTFGNTGIPELEIPSVTSFVDNLIDNNSVPVMRAREMNQVKKSQTTNAYDYMEVVLGKATNGLATEMLGY